MRTLNSKDAKYRFGRLIVPPSALRALVDGIRRSALALVWCLAVAPALAVPRVSAQETDQGNVFEGNVRDARTVEPLAGAHVSVVGRDTRAVTRGDGTST
ncbi:MAG: hypothetical protein OXR82_17360 [Gammaproteobacteria bacterium]|nr:hypothetical protein [Gammaproteobacteria bacterium]